MHFILLYYIFVRWWLYYDKEEFFYLLETILAIWHDMIQNIVIKDRHYKENSYLVILTIISIFWLMCELYIYLFFKLKIHV